MSTETQSAWEFDARALWARIRERWVLVATCGAIGLAGGIAVAWLTLPVPGVVARFTFGSAAGLAPEMSYYVALFQHRSVKAIAADARARMSVIADSPVSLEMSVVAPDAASGVAAADQIGRRVVTLAQNRLQVQRCRGVLDTLNKMEEKRPSIIGRIAQEDAALEFLMEQSRSLPAIQADVQREILLTRVRLRQLNVARDRLDRLSNGAAQLRAFVDAATFDVPLPVEMKNLVADLARTGGFELPPGIETPAADLMHAAPPEVLAQDARRAVINGAIVGFAVGLTIAIAFLLVTGLPRQLTPME